jgi:protein-disulfide isomerase
MLSKWLGGLAVVAAVVFIAPAPRAGELTNEQRDQFGKFIHDYVVSHPELVREAAEELDRREKAAEAADRDKTMTSEAAQLFRSSNQAVVGNPDGDVTLVEFFDYNCGYCKQSLANVTKLIESDPKLRVVLKDFAILGPESVEVAEVATAVRQQLKGQKFWEFHKRLLGTRGHVGKAQAMAIAKDLGADTDQLEKDIKSPATRAALAEVEGLAEKLHFGGTPSWIIGQDAYVGGLSFPDMKAKIDNVRKCGKATC